MAKTGPKGPRPLNKKTYPDVVNGVHINIAKLYSRIYDSPHGCKYMTGARHRQGYPMLGGRKVNGLEKTMLLASRTIYEIETGVNPGSHNVLHTCLDMSCVNPQHLVLGDAKKKMEMIVMAGRHNNGSDTRKKTGPKKQMGRVYKYSEDEIRWVRDPRTTTDMIAQRYGITKAKASARKWSWTHDYFQWLEQ